LRQGWLLGGVVSANGSTQAFLDRDFHTRHMLGSMHLETVDVTKGGNVFPAPKSDCVDHSHCSSVYRMQNLQINNSNYTSLSYNGSENALFKIARSPVLHAIVEPYDQSFFSESYESDDICRRYGHTLMQNMMCVGDAYDSKANEPFVIIGVHTFLF
jgi:hypothetical protein